MVYHLLYRILLAPAELCAFSLIVGILPTPVYYIEQQSGRQAYICPCDEAPILCGESWQHNLLMIL